MSMMTRIYVMLIFFLNLYSSASAITEVKAEILLCQGQLLSAKQCQFQPVFPVQIAVNVKNIGNAVSEPMQLFVRYAYPQPYHLTNDSILFQTESLEVPPLQPGEAKVISFTKSHALPTIDDFVRHYWAMREYQAVAAGLQAEDEIIGRVNLTYSAYYYPINAN